MSYHSREKDAAVDDVVDDVVVDVVDVFVVAAADEAEWWYFDLVWVAGFVGWNISVEAEEDSDCLLAWDIVRDGCASCHCTKSSRFNNLSQAT